MSPGRIRNESYSYPADIWSLVLALLECSTREFSYTANEGPVNLMLQILDDPSPPKHKFSPEFCSFIDACLQKDADAPPAAIDVEPIDDDVIESSARAFAEVEEIIKPQPPPKEPTFNCPICMGSLTEEMSTIFLFYFVELW